MTTETIIRCDACRTMLADAYPGEDYTTITVERAVKRYHRLNTTKHEEYHFCGDHVEPQEESAATQFYRARDDQIPMMLLSNNRPGVIGPGPGFAYLARENFPERYEELARLVEQALARDHDHHPDEED